METEGKMLQGSGKAIEKAQPAEDEGHINTSFSAETNTNSTFLFDGQLLI